MLDDYILCDPMYIKAGVGVCPFRPESERDLDPATAGSDMPHFKTVNPDIIKFTN